MDSLEYEERERAFYSHVREWIISLLLAVALYLLSYWLVARYKKHKTREECYSGEEDAVVYRITTWLCSFSLCVSLASGLLLPLSIFSNEVLLHYPNSAYMQWLNTSLIQGLWNQVFLGCNVSLLLLLPFAFFFTESAGLAGFRKGVMSRVYETVLVVLLVAVMAAGLAVLLSGFLPLSLHEQTPVWWLFSCLPVLYSLVALFGVLLTCLCTPLGFAAAFSVLGQLLSKPMLSGSNAEEIEQLQFEEQALQRRYKLTTHTPHTLTPHPSTPNQLDILRQRRKRLERQERSSPWERHVVYPLCFLVLLALTLLALGLVAINILSLLLAARGGGPAELGRESTSHLGTGGALVEMAIICYLLCASVVGVYSSPFLRWLRPTLHNTPLTKVIANCIVLLVLTSALPLMSTTLGITQYNLLGLFGRFDWLSSFWLVLAYNLIFFASTLAILSRKVTRSLTRQASALLGSRLMRKHSKSPNKVAHSE